MRFISELLASVLVAVKVLVGIGFFISWVGV
jgi:hypothetical protein